MKKINEFDLFNLNNNITKIIRNIRTNVYTFVGWHNGNIRTLGQVHINFFVDETTPMNFVGSTIYGAHFVKFDFKTLYKILQRFEKTGNRVIMVGGRRARMELKK